MDAGERKMLVLEYVASRRHDGATWFEVGEEMNIHHGQSSSALSSLHREGRLCRLSEKRGKSSIYVIPDCVDGREVEQYGRQYSVRRSDVDVMMMNELNESVVQIYGLMNVVKPKYPQVHYTGCWQKHPYCALAVAARQLTERKNAFARR